RSLAALAVIVVAGGTVRADGPQDCLVASGDAAARCLRDYVDTIARCRAAQDAACETAARADGGPLATFLGSASAGAARRCDDAAARALDYFGGQTDLAGRTAEACQTFGEELLARTFSASIATLEPTALRCQKAVSRAATRLRQALIRTGGRRCLAQRALPTA